MRTATAASKHRPFMGRVAFVRAAAGMSSGSYPGVIASGREPLPAEQDGVRLALQDPLHPGAGSVEA